MSKIPFTKPPLTYSHQLRLLKDRGLLVENESKALHLLESVSYYRISGYWYPLLEDKINHVFKKDASFDKAFNLYCFDKDLRRLVLTEIEKIEVAVRAKMAYVLSHKHGPFWILNKELFKSNFAYDSSLNKINSEFERSDEEFIKAFSKKYSDALPPAWICLEIVSFGTLSMLYSNLKYGKEKREIANYFGVNDKVFESWLHSIVYIRNVCAHHSRLWNRTLSISPQIPIETSKCWINTSQVRNNKVYFVLSIIRYLLLTVNPNSTFPIRLKYLLSSYKNVDPFAMNFPLHWEDEEFWK